MTPLELLHAGKALLAESPEMSSADAWLSMARAAKHVSPSSYGALAIAMGSSELRQFEAVNTHGQVLAAWDRAIEHLQERGV